MKVIFVLFLIIGLGIYFLIQSEGMQSYDPNEQGEAAKAAIQAGTPGMIWTAVVDTAGEPKEYQIINRKVKTVLGEEREWFVPGPTNKFNADTVEGRIADGSLPHGFIFPFHFSQRVAFAVKFDGDGYATQVSELQTMADMLDMK